MVAKRIGVELMPWQRMVAQVGGEIDSDTGLPAYRQVVVTVPRQSGKTTLILGWELQRALGWDTPQRIVYSAQSGNDARKKLIEDQVPILEPKKQKLGIRRILRGMGNEAIEFGNGSRIVLLASTSDSGHGKTVDLAIRDELFADYDDRRDQALIPAMATRPAAQMLTASTMGTDESFPLNAAVDRGRQAVDRGMRNGIAYFEWSADPMADPADPATWRGCMPALGHTITESVVEDSRIGMSAGEFARAFLNIQTKADDRVIPLPAWLAVCREQVEPIGELVFGIDVNPERSAGSLAAVGTVGDSPAAELVDHRPGTGWLLPRAVELDQRHGPATWVVDVAGPAGPLIVDLERAGLRVVPVTYREMVEACARFYDAVVERRVAIRKHPDLDAAAAGAKKRSVGDAWAWARKNGQTDISPLVAVTLACWAAGRPDEGASVYEAEGLLAL